MKWDTDVNSCAELLYDLLFSMFMKGNFVSTLFLSLIYLAEDPLSLLGILLYFEHISFMSVRDERE